MTSTAKLPKAPRRDRNIDDVRLTIQSCVSALRLTRCTDPEVQTALLLLEKWLTTNEESQ
jgi:hypothetical protein